MRGRQTAELAWAKVRPTASPVYETFWHFAAERQDIYFRRLDGADPPWTTDPILGRNRFTNVYRAADRVSQYLIKRVIYGGAYSAENLLFRILLFKIFNRIATWEVIEREVGDITFESFSYEEYDRIMSRVLMEGGHLYSAAYIMPPPQGYGLSRKHQNHLVLLDSMLRGGLSRQVARTTSLEQLYHVLLDYPSLGPFLAYQYAIDINYSELTDFSEAEFVVPGPGAARGIRKCFTGSEMANGPALIRLVCEMQDAEWEARGILFKTLWGRRLHLIDIQNLFCEVDKYSRVAHPDVTPHRGQGRQRIKQLYRQSGFLEAPWFPPKWGLNERLQAVEDSRR
jgi:hypothetical protein